MKTITYTHEEYLHITKQLYPLLLSDADMVARLIADGSDGCSREKAEALCDQRNVGLHMHEWDHEYLGYMPMDADGFEAPVDRHVDLENRTINLYWR